MSKKVLLHKMYVTNYPLKVHIILSHVNDYVDMVEGGLSKRGSNQVTEAAHQLLKARMDKSHYWIKKVGCEEEGEGLLRGTVHTNAYNM